MSEIHLTEQPWKTLAIQQKIKDTTLNKALGKLSLCQQKDDREGQLKALKEIKECAIDLKVVHEANEVVVNYLEKVRKEADETCKALELTRKAPVAKEEPKPTPKTEEKADQETDPGLKGRLTSSLRSIKSADGSESFAFLACIAKPFCGLLLGKSATETLGPTHKTMLTELTQGTRFISGRCLFEKNAHTFIVDPVPAGLAKNLKAAIHHFTDASYKVRIRDGEGKVVEDADAAGDETIETLKQKFNEDLFSQVRPLITAIGRETEIVAAVTLLNQKFKSGVVPEASEALAKVASLFADLQAMAPLKEKYEKIKPIIQELLRANPTRSEEIKLAVGLVTQKFQSGTSAEASGALGSLGSLLKSLQGKPGQPAVDTGAADWKKHFEAVDPTYQEVLKTQPANASELRAAMASANASAELPDFIKAGEALARLEVLLKAARTSGKETDVIPEGIVDPVGGESIVSLKEKFEKLKPRIKELFEANATRSEEAKKAVTLLGQKFESRNATQASQAMANLVSLLRDLQTIDSLRRKFNETLKPLVKPRIEANPNREAEVVAAVSLLNQRLQSGTVAEASEALVSLATLLKSLPAQSGSSTASTPQGPSAGAQPPITGASSEVPSSTNSPEESPAPILKAKNQAVKQAIEALNQRIANATTDEARLKLASEAMKKVSSADAKTLAAMSAEDQIQLLAKLKCHAPDGVIPELQQKALTKLYCAIRLDKDFREHDDTVRNKTLEQLVTNDEVKKARAAWGQTAGLTESKKALLKKIQGIQAGNLGLKGATITFGPVDEGASGFCEGKKVIISTQLEPDPDFDEILDTVIHETTHAYQRFLVEELDAGRLTEDDARYAQAWLFKLNDGIAMAEAPGLALKAAAQNDPESKRAYDAAYLAYKRQPLEEHAWKAGNEAGRAFDVNAVGLELAALTRDISRLVPDKTQAAAALLKKFQARNTIMEGTDLIAELDALANEAYPVIDEKVMDLYKTMNQYVAGGFALYQRQRNAIHTSRENPRTKLKKMSALAATLEKKTEQGKAGLAEYAKFIQNLATDTAEEEAEADRILGNRNFSKLDMLEQLKTSPILAAARKRAGLS